MLETSKNITERLFYGLIKPSYGYYIRAIDDIGNEKTLPNVNPETSPYPIEVFDYGTPKITHEPVLFYGDEDISISAVISDNIGIDNVTFYFKEEGAPSYNSSAMTNNGEGHVYSSVLPVASFISSNVSYYVSATDGMSVVTHPLNIGAPHSIQYIPTALPGGDLRVAIQDDISTLNPLLGADYWTTTVLNWIYDRPITIDPDNYQIVPYIAVGTAATSTDIGTGEVNWTDCDVGDFGFTDPSTWGIEVPGSSIGEAIVFYDFEDVLWHDDEQMDIRDIMFSMHVTAQMPAWAASMNCLKDMAGGAGSNYSLTSWLNIYKVWESPDSLQAALKFVMTEPYADFFRSTLSPMILPEHIWAYNVSGQNVNGAKIWCDPGYNIANPDSWQIDLAMAYNNPNPVGSGFFEFDYWDIGQTVNLITWRDHFYEPGFKYDGYGITPPKQPNIDSMLFKIYKTAEAAVMALRNDDIDYIAWNIPPTFVQELTNEPGVSISQSPQKGFFYMAYNMRRQSFGYDENKSFPYAIEDDLGKQFRKAVAHCIDKNRIVERLLLNYGIAGEGPVSSISSWFNETIPRYSFDPEEAINILESAGYILDDPGSPPGSGNYWNNPNGSDIGSGPSGVIEILTPEANYDPIRAQAGLMIAQQLRDIGINADSVAMDFDTIVNRIDQRDFDMYILGWNIGTPPTDYLHAFFHSENAAAGQNYPGYMNESFDEDIDLARQTGDEEIRKQAVEDAQAAIVYDLPYDVLYYRTNIEAYRSDNFIGWRVGSSGSIYNQYSIMNIRHPSLPLPSQTEEKYSGGDLRVAIEQEPNILNPLASTDEETMNVIDLVYDSLARTDPYSLEIIPWIAESWTVSPGNTNITVTLCSGVTWHDGTPVTATDVKYTFDTYGLPYLASTNVIGNYTVIFNLFAPNALFFNEALMMPLIPDGFNASSEENGCGPFKFKEKVNGDHLTLEAYDDYFNGRVNIDSITFTYYPYIEADFSADYPYSGNIGATDPRWFGSYRASYDLIAGELDFIGWDLSTTELSTSIEVDYNITSLIYSSDSTVIKNHGQSLKHIGFNNAAGHILNDVNLRKAITYSVGKEYLTYFDISGGLEISNSIMNQYNYPYWNETVPKYQFDLQEANLILDEAGYFDRDGDGWRDLPYAPYESFNLTLLGPPMEDIVEYTMSTVIVSWIQQIGINISLNSSSDSERNALIATDNFDLYFGELMGEQDPGFLNGLAGNGSVNNYANYADATMGALLDRMNTEMNMTLRAQYAQDCEGWLAEQVPYDPLFHEKVNNAYNNKRFEGWVSTLGGIDNFWTYLSVYPLFDPTPVDPPVALYASGPWADSINLTWAPNLETDLTGYNIYRANTSGGPYSMIDSVGLITAYLDSSVNGSMDCYYVITGIINGSESSYSNEAFCVILIDNAAPYYANEHVGMNNVTGDPRPTLWVHVLDNVAVDVSTIRLYVMGFPVFYDLAPIPGGYNVSYIHGGDYNEGPITVRIVARDTSDNLLDFTWTWYLDLTPPVASNIDPAPDSICLDITPTIQLDVTDDDGVEIVTMRLYVQDFAIWYEFTPIANGYHLWYTHEPGFLPGELVRCRIVAEDSLGNWLDYSWNFTIAESSFVEIPLQAGWNLISFPLEQADTTISTVLSSINGQYDVVKYYDVTDENDPWKTYRPGASTNDLMNIDHKMGFWINMLNSTILTVSGTEPVTTNIPLYTGWNLVSYPSLGNATTVGMAFFGTGADHVEVFDPAEPYLIKEVAPTYVMQPGEGYWIHVPADTVWTVDW